jgi:hypothetical protein
VSLPCFTSFPFPLLLFLLFQDPHPCAFKEKQRSWLIEKCFITNWVLCSQTRRMIEITVLIWIYEYKAETITWAWRTFRKDERL